MPGRSSLGRRLDISQRDDEDLIQLQSCERRLVLSAQLLFDVLADPALDMHGSLVTPADSPLGHSSSICNGSQYSQAISASGSIDAIVYGPQLQSDAPPLESHLREAHAASGWNVVQEQFGLTGRGQTVAVIDSGIAWDHVALGEGYGPGYRVVGGWDFTEENDAQPYDDGPSGFHGTHVAGIIGSDDATHTGVARDVDLVALRVFNDMGQGQLSWVERALQWVHDNQSSFENPITTVNLSLGTTWNADVIPNWANLEEELQALYDDGIVVTASAGNSFQQYQATGLSYPAASSYVLPVASVGDDGLLSDFSQRNERVLAAPGENMMSTVPDHVLGRDGNVNDFAAASGTSMSAPYTAGASVLVRQAMELTGIEDINLDRIVEHLRSTADSVFDTVTGASYDRLNLATAIESLIPIDTVGNVAAHAETLSLESSTLGGWINTLGDVDAYRFTADTSGTLDLDVSSDWVHSLGWSIRTGGSVIAQGDTAAQSLSLAAGQTYELFVSAEHEIGPFSLDLNFTSSSAGDGSNGESSGSGGVDLGTIDYFHDNQSTSGGNFVARAAQDGLFTVQWSDSDAQTGSLSVTTATGQILSDSVWENGDLRVDVPVNAGDELRFSLPSGGADSGGSLTIANVLEQSSSQIHVRGTANADSLGLDLSSGTELRFGEITYAWPAGEINSLTIDGYGNNDSITIVGSSGSDKVDLHPTHSTLENHSLNVQLNSIEQVAFEGGGGPDRVYLYDSDGDDTLNAHPRHAELKGAGYEFSVSQVDRIFVHASGGGQDHAYLFDSEGDDRLSVRPQFMSMAGDGYFNLVRGFERVYAYASDGIDVANLYDSAGDDRFATSGTSASIVGPGFSSFTRGFDQANAFADAGGADTATLYGTTDQTQWHRVSGFVQYRDNSFVREVRGFEHVDTFQGGQPFAFGHDRIAPSRTESVDAPSQDGVPTPVTWEESSLPPAHIQSEQIQSAQSLATHGLSDPMVGEELHAKDWQAEQASLDALQEFGDWITHNISARAIHAERLELPEAELMSDPELESRVLDEVFEIFSRNS